MAEAIDLPPLHVQAIRVPVQPPPNSIVGPAEVFLQQGENGGVQIDTFWRDAMGNEIHESTEMQEEEYEALRARYMRTEQATLPPFSSFKGGNTIGRVVGETAPAAVPVSQANPPIEAETEEEGITGEQVLDGIQLGLDVFGLIPVIGEAADLANAVVSLARGDYVGAGLSLLSAIPFVGYAGTAGKLTKRATNIADTAKKSEKADEAATIASKTGDESGKKTGREIVDAPNKNTDSPQNSPPPEHTDGFIVQRKSSNDAKGTVREIDHLASSKVKWVDENAGMSSRARDYNDSATGARSNISTQSGQAPSLKRTMPDGSKKQVKFDGVDGNVLVDRKISVVTTKKSKDQALRQSEALSQNGLTARWEVPTQAQATRAQKMFDELKIKNISVKVVNE